MAEVIYKKRNPMAALMLSMLCLGLGHIYCGKLVAGLVLMLLMLLPIALVLVAAFSNNGAVLILVAVILPSIAWAVIYCYGISDSYRLAKRIGDGYALKDYNRGSVYALFIAINLVSSIAVSPVAALFIREQVAEAFVGANDSMNPTILRGDRFLVNKFLERQMPNRGDVIVFIAPDNRNNRNVRRVVGLPGDTVRMDGNDVYVNGKMLQREPVGGENASQMRETNGDAVYRIVSAADPSKAASCPETSVPPSHCFVLCDNRNERTDSRTYGFIPLGDILGKAECIYFPAKDWSRAGGIDRH